MRRGIGAVRRPSYTRSREITVPCGMPRTSIPCARHSQASSNRGCENVGALPIRFHAAVFFGVS